MKAVFGKRIYTGEDAIENSYVAFEDGNIVSVSADKPDCEIIGEYEVITPAFIDAHSHIGMERAGEPSEDGDVNEQMESIMFESDALDAIQMDDKSFADSVENGILYSCVLPGSGNIIGGRAVVVRNYAKNTEQAFIKYSGIKSAFGYNPKSTTDWKGARPSTRMGSVALFRTALKKAQKTMKLLEMDKKNINEIEPQEEIIIKLLKREERLRVHVHKEDDISALIRMRDEFNLNIAVEHTCDVNSQRAYEMLKQRGIPVVYGPVDGFAYKVELKHENWRNIEHLLKSGVRFGLMTDHPVILQRMLLYQLRYFLRFGLSKSECIKIITKNNAEILGINDVLGTITERKKASLVCWNGDPFDMSAFPVSVIAEGKAIL